MKKQLCVFAIIFAMILVLGGCKAPVAPDSSEALPQTAIPSEFPPASVASEPVESASIDIHIDLATAALLDKYSSFQEYISDEDGDRLIIWTDADLKDLAFIAIDFVEKGDRISYLAGDILFSVDEFSPVKPFVVKLLIPGTVAAYGISFVDVNGVERFYTINLSGRGSEEAPPYFLLEFENGKNQ